MEPEAGWFAILARANLHRKKAQSDRPRNTRRHRLLPHLYWFRVRSGSKFHRCGTFYADIVNQTPLSQWLAFAPCLHVTRHNGGLRDWRSGRNARRRKIGDGLGAQRISPHRLGNVLDALFAQILESIGQLVTDLVAHHPRDAGPSFLNPAEPLGIDQISAITVTRIRELVIHKPSTEQ